MTETSQADAQNRYQQRKEEGWPAGYVELRQEADELSRDESARWWMRQSFNGNT